MQTINHYTLVTRNNRISYPNEVDSSMYLYLKRMIKDAQRQEGADILEGTNLILTVEEDCYIGTLRLKTDTDYIPILLTSGTNKKEKRFYVWDNLNKLKNDIYPYEKVFDVPPSAPLILDLILPAPVNSKIFDWTGDFTRCLGWIMMYPELIK